jgi:hypothetical protein
MGPVPVVVILEFGEDPAGMGLVDQDVVEGFVYYSSRSSFVDGF